MPTVSVPEEVTKSVFEPTTKVITTTTMEMEVIESSTVEVEETTTVEKSTTGKSTTEKSTTAVVTQTPKEAEVTADPFGSGESEEFDTDGADDGSTSNDELSPMVPNEIIFDETDPLVAENEDDLQNRRDAQFTSTLSMDLLTTEGFETTKYIPRKRQPGASCDISHSDVKKESTGFFSWSKKFPNLAFRIINNPGKEIESVLYESEPSREQNRSFQLPSFEISENDFSNRSDVQIEWWIGNNDLFGNSVSNTAEIFGFGNEAPGSNEANPIMNAENQVGNTYLSCKFLDSDE